MKHGLMMLVIIRCINRYSNPPVAVLNHNYAKTTDDNNSSISHVKSSAIPAEVAAILPPTYKYDLVNMERIETELCWFT